MGISALTRWTDRAQRLLKQPELPISIDFGVGSLKILQIQAASSEGEPPQLVSAACLETPPELLSDPARRLTYQAQALPRLMKSTGFKGKRAVCAIPASLSVCRHMQFAAVDAVGVASAARTQLPLQMGQDPSNVVVKHVEVGAVGRAADGTGKTEVICMGVGRDVVSQLMSAIVSCKTDPVGIHSEFQAIVRAFAHITRRNADANLVTLYVDLGAGTTKVVLSHGTNLVFARSIEFGGRHLDQAVATHLKIDLKEARQQRHAMVTSEPDRPVVTNATEPRQGDEERRTRTTAPGLTGDIRLRPAEGVLPVDLPEPLEIMTDEIGTCLRYYESMFPDKRIGRVIFVGGESRHVGLCQHISRVLKLPAQVADPLACLSRTGREPAHGVDVKSAQPGWAVALGLCLCPTDL